ncbi:hypothetical protein MKEN_00177200 [Mycena kentingensis (nom. inval.)]|nr:hypothetical protein MKEN_00177200 [Mycena kentingensis (nom. inval.)]
MDEVGYDPSDPRWMYAQQQQHQHQPQGFDFACPPPATSFDGFPEYFPHYTQERPPYDAYDAQSLHTTAQSSSSGLKRRRVVRQDSGHSEAYNNEPVYNATGGSSSRTKAARPSGACKHCKRLKMRCEFAVDEDGELEETCVRCHHSGNDCIVEGRKPRSAPNKRQYLLAQIEQKDAMIESLLKQLHNPYTATPMAIASYERKATPSDAHSNSLVDWCDPARDDDVDEDNVGVANASYFRPGPSTDLNKRTQLIQAHSPPEIVLHGLVTPEDVEELFEIFYTHINPFIALLDPALHTSETTFVRCPFLFTVVCAIAARYHPSKAEIYPVAMHFAKNAAAAALVDGWKSVEICQAYILMSIYGVPTQKWDEDRGWVYAGLAIRLAMDLDLHEVAARADGDGDDAEQRERLNRSRVWVVCFVLDRSLAIQSGKPATIKDDFILRHGGDDWYKMSPLRGPHDLYLTCHASLLRLVTSFREDVFSDPLSPTGLNRRIDIRALTLTYEANLTRLVEEWTRRLDEEVARSDADLVLARSLFALVAAYSRLMMLFIGFSKSADMSLRTMCLESAKKVVRSTVDDLAQDEDIKYAPDEYFAMSAFAASFLLKNLRPAFADETEDILNLVARLIGSLSTLAIDARHTPSLYACFLTRLMSRHRLDGSSIGTMPLQSPPIQPSPGQDGTSATSAVVAGPSRPNTLHTTGAYPSYTSACSTSYATSAAAGDEGPEAIFAALKAGWLDGFSWAGSDPSVYSPGSSNSLSPYGSEQPLPPHHSLPFQLGATHFAQ